MVTIFQKIQAITGIANAMNITIAPWLGPLLVTRDRIHTFGLLFPQSNTTWQSTIPPNRVLGALDLSDKEAGIPSIRVFNKRDFSLLAFLSQRLSGALGTPVSIVFLENKAPP